MENANETPSTPDTPEPRDPRYPLFSREELIELAHALRKAMQDPPNEQIALTQRYMLVQVGLAVDDLDARTPIILGDVITQPPPPPPPLKPDISLGMPPVKGSKRR